MKIFQVVTVSEYGGAQSVVSNLTEALSQDNKVFLLYGGDGDAWKNLDKRITKLRISGHRKGISWKDLFLLIRLLFYRIKYKPDIVHLHSSKMGALGRIAFSPRKTVYTVHGFDSIRLAYRQFLFVEKLLRNRVAKIIGVSKYDVEGLKAEGIVKNVTLVYNGLTDYSEKKISQYNKSIEEQIFDIKKAYPKIIMCIARISKQKKFDLFVDIAKEMPEYAFVWIGNKDKIDDLPQNVFCLGESSSAHHFLSLADIFILPSNYEGLPVSILEALSYSLPVVASNVGGIPEILDGSNGFTVDNNVESFKEKIEYILKSENYKNMSEAARNSYLKNFTIDKMIDGYRNIFEQIYKSNNGK